MKSKHPTQISIVNLTKHVVSEVFFIDGKIAKTVISLFSEPGKLSLDQCSEDASHSTSPIRLYFGINLLFFFLIPFLTTTQFKVFNFSLESLTIGNDAYQSVIESQIQRTGISEEVYRERFNANLNYSKSAYLFLVVPIFAFAMYAMNFRNRPYYFEHFIFSLHFFSFFLVSLLATALAIRLGAVIGSGTITAVNISAAICLSALSLWIVVYLTFAMARFYRTSKLVCLLKLPFVLMGFVLSIGVYAQFLFAHTVLALR